MAILLDHTIIMAADPARTAGFVTHILGLAPPQVVGHFTVVRIGETALDYMQGEAPIASRHFAFRSTEREFDAIFARVKSEGLDYWADPSQQKIGQTNRRNDGEGFYFEDPDGHLLEIFWQPDA